MLATTERCPLFRELWMGDMDFRRHALQNGGMRAETENIQTHHVFGGKSRLNRKSNLIRICGTVHDWAHMRPGPMKIACLWVQRKRGVLDWVQLDECAGLSARGWCEIQTVGGVYAVMQRELLNG